MKNNGFGKRGWELIIYCILSYYVATAFKDTMSVAVLYFEENYGWNQTLLFSLASIGSYITCVVIYVLGILNSKGKIKLRAIILVTGLLYAGTISLWGVIPNLSVFILNYIVMTIGYTVWTQYANNSVCGNWFPKKSGAVMGWATIGFPLASATNAALYQYLSKLMSFRNIYFVFGAAVLIIALWGFIRFRDYPEAVGCYPDNDSSMTKEKLEEFVKNENDYGKNSIWDAKKMLSVKETWLIAVSTGVLNLVASGSMGQMVVRFMTGGMDISLAVKMMTVVGISAMIGSWVIGKFDYRFGVKKAYLGTLILMIIACVLYSVNATVTMCAGAIIIGIALGGSTNFLVSLTSTYWGRENFKKAFGTLLTINTVIGSAGAIVVANIAAWTNYSTAYYLLAALNVIALLLAIGIKSGFVERYEEADRRQRELQEK